MKNPEFTQVEEKMKACMQTETQNVLEHGESVWKYTKKIIAGNFEGMRLPDWFTENHAFIVNNLHDVETIKNYNIYHDCGKPFCITIDDEGKRHFPNHALISKETWMAIDDNTEVADLIGWDMALHSDTAEKIQEYGWDKKTAFTLLVTALAEVHSNAAMFGGIESTSFKIKWKKLDKRGKMLFNQLKEEDKHPYSYVIVRNDLSTAQKAVQGTHAAIEYYKNKSINYHPSVIYIIVKDEKKLKKVAEDLLEEGINFTVFREPMEPFGNEMTAIYTEPLEGEKRRYLQKFQLM